MTPTFLALSPISPEESRLGPGSTRNLSLRHPETLMVVRIVRIPGTGTVRTLNPPSVGTPSRTKDFNKRSFFLFMDGSGRHRSRCKVKPPFFPSLERVLFGDD